MQVGQRILQVGQLQLLDHALDQLGVASRRRPGQAAGRSWAGPTQHRTSGRLGRLEALERASDGGDLAEPLGQVPVAGGKDMDDDAPVSCAASQNAEVGSIRPSRRGGWPSATRTEETVRPAPPGG